MWKPWKPLSPKTLKELVTAYMTVEEKATTLGMILALIEDETVTRGSCTFSEFVIEKNTITFTLDWYTYGDSSYFSHVFDLGVFSESDPEAYFRAELVRRARERIEENKRREEEEQRHQEFLRIRKQADLERTLGVRD